MTDGRKDDAGKPRPTLVLGSMARAVDAVVEVAEYGARKYSPDNWLQVPEAPKRYGDALLRHLMASLRGEARDPESGLRHLAHVAWCALAVLELKLREPEAAPASKLAPGSETRMAELARQWAAEREARWARWAQEGVGTISSGQPRMVVTPTADQLRQRAIDELGKLPAVRELQHAGLIRYQWEHDSEELRVCVGVATYTVLAANLLVPDSPTREALLEWLEEQRPSVKAQADAEAILRGLVIPTSLCSRALERGLLRVRYRWSSQRPAVYIELRDARKQVLWSVKERVLNDGLKEAIEQAFITFLRIPDLASRIKQVLPQ